MSAASSYRPAPASFSASPLAVHAEADAPPRPQRRAGGFPLRDGPCGGRPLRRASRPAPGFCGIRRFSPRRFFRKAAPQECRSREAARFRGPERDRPPPVPDTARPLDEQTAGGAKSCSFAYMAKRRRRRRPCANPPTGNRLLAEKRAGGDGVPRARKQSSGRLREIRVPFRRVARFASGKCAFSLHFFHGLP